MAKFGINGAFPDVLWDGFVNAENVDADGHLLRLLTNSASA